MAGDEGKASGDEGPARGWDLLKWQWVAKPPESLSATVHVLAAIVLLLVLVSGVVALFELLAPIWGWGAIDKCPLAPGVDPGAELRGRLLIIGALLTTPFLIWRLVVSHRAARAAQGQARTAQDQARIAQETARNALFTKAVEQLGAVREVKKKVETKDANGVVTATSEETSIKPNTEVRLGAIYALEKLARDDLAMHWPIMETLCAYVRENAGPPKTPPKDIASIQGKSSKNRTPKDEQIIAAYRADFGPPNVDVQAAISVIGRRARAQRDYERVQREDLSVSAKDAWRLDLRNTHLASAKFDGLDFSHARFDNNAMQRASLKYAQLSNLSFVGAHLEDACLDRANLASADLDQSHLEGAKFRESNMECVSFEGARFWGTDFWRASLVRATLVRASLSGISLKEARLDGALLDQAYLMRGSSTMQNSGLEGAHLEGASLSGTIVDDSISRTTTLIDIRVDGADLTAADGLEQAHVDQAWGNDNTKMPAHLSRPTNERWVVAGADRPAQQAWLERWLARRNYWLAEAVKRSSAETPGENRQ
ncbi:MAG: pentapeptide repeat-containing protein [Roseiarcus sp.]|jgi:uncharacterized protein YjbI with pentapeptide repeats